MQAVDKVKNLIKGIITMHKENYDKNSLRDFIDVYLLSRSSWDDGPSVFFLQEYWRSEGNKVSVKKVLCHVSTMCQHFRIIYRREYACE
jgi:hypothetical protein